MSGAQQTLPQQDLFGGLRNAGVQSLGVQGIDF